MRFLKNKTNLRWFPYSTSIFFLAFGSLHCDHKLKMWIFSKEHIYWLLSESETQTFYVFTEYCTSTYCSPLLRPQSLDPLILAVVPNISPCCFEAFFKNQTDLVSFHQLFQSMYMKHSIPCSCRTGTDHQMGRKRFTKCYGLLENIQYPHWLQGIPRC